MPQDQRAYRVFVSSPGDVKEQRNVVKEAIQSLSSQYEKKGIALKPWLWEEQVATNLGNPAQETIFEELGEFDFYIGIMGTRFGSPTATFGSGTEEEFSDAIRRFENHKLLRVGFFFHDADISVSTLSVEITEQLLKVMKFKKHVGSLGLYTTFKENHQLALEIQKFLSTEIDRLHEKLEVSQIQYSLHAGGLPAKSPRLSRDFFENVLNPIEETISANGRMRLTLEDVWIEPGLRELVGDQDGFKAAGNDYAYSDLLNDLCEGQSLLLLGNEKTGKTSVAHRSIIELSGRGFFPILVESSRFNNPNFERLINRLRVTFLSQYENVESLDFQNIAAEKIILVVDGFDEIKIASRFLAEFIERASRFFKSCLFIASPVFAVGAFSNGDKASAVSSLKRVEITELGAKRRYDLIERWCQIGGNPAQTESELRHEIEKRRQIIDNVLGGGLVPKTPLIVLTLLQALELGQVGDLSTSGYVRYYKYLIDSAILRNAAPDTVETSYALLPEIAYAVFEKGTGTLLPEDIENTIEKLATRRALRKTNLYSAFASLKHIGVFAESNKEQKFRSNYIYYFFLADYLSKNINAAPIREQVRSLCQQVAEKEKADILAFLSFHTNDHIIIDTLVDALNGALQNAQIFDFNAEATEPINKLVYELPKQLVVQERLVENRRRRLEAEESEQAPPEDSDAESVEEDEKRALEIYVVFRAIEVLGHVLRNHYARIDASPKEEMITAILSASRRCLGDIFDNLAGSVDHLVETLIPILPRPEDNMSQAKQATMAKRIVFFLVCALIYFISRKTAKSMGDENLDISFEMVAKKQGDAASKLMLTSVKLNSYREFPLADVKDLAELLKDNRVGIAVLRWLVSERIDMRPPSDQAELQRICDAVGLDLKPRLLARGSW